MVKCCGEPIEDEEGFFQAFKWHMTETAEDVSGFDEDGEEAL